MPIAYSNGVTAKVVRPDNTTLVVNEAPVNFQRADSRWIEAMAAWRDGKDYSQCYRCRVANEQLVTGYYPQQGDIIFVTVANQEPDLLGRWVIDAVENFAGPIKSRVLYCSREILIGNV